MIPSSLRGRFPDLEPDIEVLTRQVSPVYRHFDLLALKEQNRYRRQQVLMVLGSALLTGCGGLQASLRDARWPGVVLAALGVLLAFGGRWARERGSQTLFLDARIKAERLRALHFRYLSTAGRYSGPDRQRELARAVLAIRSGRELE